MVGRLNPPIAFGQEPLINACLKAGLALIEHALRALQDNQAEQLELLIGERDRRFREATTQPSPHDRGPFYQGRGDRRQNRILARGFYPCAILSTSTPLARGVQMTVYAGPVPYILLYL